MNKDQNRNKSNNVKIEEYDKCAVCGMQTQVKKDTLVEFRPYYIEGTGQLCRKCYLEIYASIII